MITCDETTKANYGEAMSEKIDAPEEQEACQEESKLVRFAERELEFLNNRGEVNKWIRDDILELVRVFSKQGHSGTSAAYVTDMLNRILRWEPVRPLTGEGSEWKEVHRNAWGIVWQNRRCPRVFKEADGSTYDIRGIVFTDEYGSSYTCKKSHTPVKFPYTPKTRYVYTWRARLRRLLSKVGLVVWPKPWNPEGKTDD